MTSVSMSNMRGLHGTRVPGRVYRELDWDVRPAEKQGPAGFNQRAQVQPIEEKRYVQPEKAKTVPASVVVPGVTASGPSVAGLGTDVVQLGAAPLKL